MKKSRNVGLDITRIVAFISVPAIHFFLNSGYYNTPIIGTSMYIMTIMRTFFGICVPLFMLLTGYLMSAKEIKIEKREIRGYISNLFKVLETYVIATVIILIFNQIYLKEIVGVKEGLLNILGYKQYSWYVNMYIGCYLLIPFLNILWRAIATKEGHKILVCIFFVLTVLPSIVNVFNFEVDKGINIINASSYNQLIPNWWGQLYPITYYYIGAYFRTHINLKKIKRLNIVLLLIFSTLLFGLNNIIRSYANNFVWGVWCDWGSLQDTIETVLVFMLLNSFNYKENTCISKMIRYISSLTFGAYILSWISDKIVYAQLIQKVRC